MSEHLPLCDKAWTYPDFLASRGVEREDCWMCELLGIALAAQDTKRGYLDGHKDGYAAGLRAAREAVAKRCRRHHEFSWGLDESEDGDWIDRDHALAAIDALRGES